MKLIKIIFHRLRDIRHHFPCQIQSDKSKMLLPFRCRDNQKQIDDALAPLKTKLSEVMDKAKTSVGGSAAAVAKKEE